VDSSAATFEIAARSAFRQLREKGAPELLEPIVRVQVLTPGDYLSDVIGDLRSRRGRMERVDQREDAQVVSAFVPLSNMFGYPANLRGMSQDQARFTMEFSHYAPVPQPLPPEDDPPTFRPAMGMRA
jgi:elongation factor G